MKNTTDELNKLICILKERVGIHENGEDDGWSFGKSLSSVIPDYYICTGFNGDRTELTNVWIIPGNSKLVAKTGITISLCNLQRVSKYEVDATLYNNAYKNLDVYTLSEFRNLKEEYNDTCSMPSPESNKIYTNKAC